MPTVRSKPGAVQPSLKGAVLLIESAGLAIGHFDRVLTMLVRGGHFDGIKGVAVGHIDGTPPNPPLDAIELLREHVSGFGVPVLGGLPIGHHADARSVIIGMAAEINADTGTLTQRSQAYPLVHKP